MQTSERFARSCAQWASSAQATCEAHLRFASDAPPCCCAGPSLVVRALKPDVSAEEPPSTLLDEWFEAKRAHAVGGVPSKPFEFVAGCPIRFRVGGTGGSRREGPTRVGPTCGNTRPPRQALLHMSSDLSDFLAACIGVSFDVLNALGRTDVGGRQGIAALAPERPALWFDGAVDSVPAPVFSGPGCADWPASQIPPSPFFR